MNHLTQEEGCSKSSSNIATPNDHPQIYEDQCKYKLIRLIVQNCRVLVNAKNNQ